MKDIEDGKSRHNKSDIHYSIDNENDDIENDLLDNDSDDLEDEYEVDQSGEKVKKPKKKKKPIYNGKANSNLDNANVTRGSENSLLNLTDDDLLLRKGMDEDGSFREGRYADGE